MATKALPLKKTIVRHLRTILRAGVVSDPDEHLTVVINNSNGEQNYGSILQQIHRVIDEHCPDREENIYILLRDEAGSFKNVFKIWKSA